MNEQLSWLAKVEKQSMTDKSIAYNVIVRIGKQDFRFACQTHGHADEIMKNLNNCSYVEPVVGG